MRKAGVAALALLVLGGLGWFASANPGDANRQMPHISSSMIVVTDENDRRQQLTIVDPTSQSVCVYHIDSASGAITLKSVRNIRWDLRLTEFNSASPLPDEIRSLVQP